MCSLGYIYLKSTKITYAEVNIVCMKKLIFTYVGGFVCGVATGIALCLFNPMGNSIVGEQTTNSVVVVFSPSETNRASTTPNVDWFKSNSNYIWDGWKIK
jgi:hypothetical protein